MLRALLISHSGGSGNPAVVADAQRRFKAFMAGEDPAAVHPSLRLSIFYIAIKAGGRTEYESMKKFYAETTSVDGKEIALQSMGYVNSPKLAREVLEFTFSPAVLDKRSPVSALASNSGQRSVVWEFVKERWVDKVFPELSRNMAELESWLRIALSNYSDFGTEKDIAAFLRGRIVGVLIGA
jgi:ERAP1-like C-terminal domain